MKNDHEMAQIFNNIDEHGSDAECLDLYHKQTQLRQRTQKHPNLGHAHRVLGPLSSVNTIPMLGYITALI